MDRQDRQMDGTASTTDGTGQIDRMGGPGWTGRMDDGMDGWHPKCSTKPYQHVLKPVYDVPIDFERP